MGLKGQSHRGANGRDSGRQTEKKGDERRGKRRQWECMFHSRNKRLYELTTIFEERARAQEWTASFYERTQDHVVSLHSFPSVLQNEIFPTRENHASFTFRTVSYRFRTGFVQVLYNVVQPCNSFSIQIWQLFLWHLVPSIWIISNSGEWNNIFLLFINVSNRLNRLDCGAIRTSNGYWWSLYWN